MATRRKRLRHEEELEEQGLKPAQEAVEEKERPKEREATAAERVLDLQKTAGNRATAAAISRLKTGTAAPKWPKEPEVIVDGVVIPMSSFTWGGSNNGAFGTGGSGVTQRVVTEVSVVTPASEHSSDLYRKGASGASVKTVIIVVPRKEGGGFTAILTDVVISSFSTDGRTDSWTMTFAKHELSMEPPGTQAQARPHSSDSPRTFDRGSPSE
jgi:Type VI secretion system effector, Hcp